MARKLEFENGRLVKVDGMRPDYMGGHALINLVRELAKGREPGWTFRTYRVEWVTEVFVIDQYGLREPREAPLYQRVFPEAAQARAELNRIATKDPHHLRMVWKDAPHSYHDCHVTRRETLVEETS